MLQQARQLRSQALAAIAKGKPHRPAEAKALELFEQACTKGNVQGCAEAQELLEGQHLQGLSGAQRPAPTRFADAERRLARLVQRHCQLAPRGWPQARACRAAGLVLAERDATGAKQAFSKSCRVKPGPSAECEARWHQLVDALSTLPGPCQADEANKCFELGRNLWRIGERSRAAQAFQQECLLRGLTNALVQVAKAPATAHEQAGSGLPTPLPLPDTAGPYTHCVNEYARRSWQSWVNQDTLKLSVATTASQGSPSADPSAFRGDPPGPVSARTAKGKLTMELCRVTVDGPLQGNRVRRAAGKLRSRLLGCYERALLRAPKLAGEIRLRLLVDQLGEPFQITASAAAPQANWMVGCASAVLHALQLPPQPKPSVIEIPLRLQPRK